MRKLRKRIGVTVAVAIALAVAAPAVADGYAYYYNVTMPWGQQPRNTGVQEKTVAHGDGYIWVYDISDSYNIDAQMCTISGLYCGGGTKVYNLTDASGGTHTYHLPNTYSAGDNRAINIQPSTWNIGNVTSIGNSSVN